ncbi:MAG: DUF418 domain-containing protein [Gemmobacter sp.]
MATGLAAQSPAPVGAGYSGDVWEAAAQRTRDWPPALGFVLLFNGLLAPSAFCAGLAAHRTGPLDPDSPHRTVLRGAVPELAAVGIVATLAHRLAFGAILGSTEAPPAASFGFAALGRDAPALGLVYLVAVIEAARRWGVPGWMTVAGSMSATVYVGQGLLGGLIFNGCGLGLYDSLHRPLIALSA